MIHYYILIDSNCNAGFLKCMAKNGLFLFIKTKHWIVWIDVRLWCEYMVTARFSSQRACYPERWCIILCWSISRRHSPDAADLWTQSAHLTSCLKLYFEIYFPISQARMGWRIVMQCLANPHQEQLNIFGVRVLLWGSLTNLALKEHLTCMITCKPLGKQNPGCLTQVLQHVLGPTKRCFSPNFANNVGSADSQWPSDATVFVATIIIRLSLTHWGRDKMTAISQRTDSSAFSWIKTFEF